MKYLEIGTPYGDCYIVNEQGYITQDRYGVKPCFSGSWIMKGVIRVNTSCRLAISLQELFEMDLDSVQWRYKNGNPRFTVMDVDHGTTRAWGNTKYHGIRYICKVERD